MSSPPGVVVTGDGEHERRGICEDESYLEEYDPEASDVIATRCPGCGGVIVVFQSGEVAQPRSNPPEAGVATPLLDLAFEKHFCPARDGHFACKKCGDRSDAPDPADRCCSGPYEQSGYVRVSGADPIGGEADDG